MVDVIRQAIELFPLLTEEEKAIVHELIISLKQSPSRAAVPEETEEQDHQS